MKTKLILVFSAVFVLGILNQSLYQKEHLKAHGETIYLEIIPLDPRAFLQGDYMKLRFKVARQIRFSELSPDDRERGGYLIIRPDAEHVGQYVRLYKGEKLGAKEKKLKLKRAFFGGSLQIIPNRFFFQEGDGARYENAKYAIFKFGNSGSPIITGLLNENKRPIAK